MYTNEEAALEAKSLKKVKVWKSKILNKISIYAKNNKYLLATLRSIYNIFSS